MYVHAYQIGTLMQSVGLYHLVNGQRSGIEYSFIAEDNAMPR